jgi:26S proteasome regulatory subunit N7
MDLNFSGEAKKKREVKAGGWSEGEITAELKKHDDIIEDCKANKGEIEVRDAILDKADFINYDAKNFVEGEKIYREAYKLTGGASKKMEILFEILLMNIDKMDIESISKDITECHKLVEDGADWDKKNKLKIFEGVYCMMIRDFKKASNLFVSSIATFTAVELMSFTDFVFYAVVLGLLTQDRKTIKKEIIHSPDILAVNRDIPHLKEFSESFYNCDYKVMFKSFIEICV